MSGLIIPETHICSSSSQDIFDIVKPLFAQYPINFFDFVRILTDNTFIQLTSDYEVTKYVYQKGYTVLPAIDLTTQTTIYHLANTNELLSTFTQDLQEIFSIQNYFLIVKKGVHYIDAFCFGGKPCLSNPTHFYLNHLDIFEKFTVFFKEKAQNIIEAANHDRLNLADVAQGEYPKILDLLLPHQQPHFKKYNFFNKLFPIIEERLIEILYNFNVQLTQQEKSCLIYAFLGMNSKSISKELDISYRTAQVHLENVKNKFGIFKKSQLLELFKL